MPLIPFLDRGWEGEERGGRESEEGDVDGWIWIQPFPSRGTQRPIAEGNVDQPYPPFHFGERGEVCCESGPRWVLCPLGFAWGEGEGGLGVWGVGEVWLAFDAGRDEVMYVVCWSGVETDIDNASPPLDRSARTFQPPPRRQRRIAVFRFLLPAETLNPIQHRHRHQTPKTTLSLPSSPYSPSSIKSKPPKYSIIRSHSPSSSSPSVPASPKIRLFSASSASRSSRWRRSRICQAR